MESIDPIEMSVQQWVNLLKTAQIKDVDDCVCTYMFGGPMIVDRDYTEGPLVIFFSPEQGEFFKENLDEIKVLLSE